MRKFLLLVFVFPEKSLGLSKLVSRFIWQNPIQK